jgi:ubiquinone/menaquinone biosynthesis C-methylase UbiE
MPEMNAVARFFVNFSARRRSRRNYEWMRREVPLPAGSRVLEIGCGNASLAVRIVDGSRPTEYVATDFDPRQIEQARRTVDAWYSGHPPPTLVLRTADMTHLEDAPSTFDAVLAFLVIHHAGATHHDFSRVPLALSEFERVLRPGGLLVYQEFLHKEPIRQWLTEHGFAIERIRRRWRLESVVARKSTGGSANLPAG